MVITILIDCLLVLGIIIDIVPRSIKLSLALFILDIILLVFILRHKYTHTYDIALIQVIFLGCLSISYSTYLDDFTINYSIVYMVLLIPLYLIVIFVVYKVNVLWEIFDYFDERLWVKLFAAFFIVLFLMSYVRCLVICTDTNVSSEITASIASKKKESVYKGGTNFYVTVEGLDHYEESYRVSSKQYDRADQNDKVSIKKYETILGFEWYDVKVID